MIEHSEELGHSLSMKVCSPLNVLQQRCAGRASSELALE
jgi:hypothetical protein